MPPAKGGQPEGTNWDVQRYKAFDKVWASLTSVNVLERTYVSYSSWKKLFLGGYVTTSKSGQAKVKQGSCFVYVYQQSKYGFSEVVKSWCEKGGSDCCSTYQNCKVVVKTLPANVTFKGTMVTVIELVDEETTVVMTHEGEAEVTYTEATANPGKVFPVPAGYAAYVSTPGGEEWAKKQFDFDPGTPVPISKSFINVLAQLGFLPQIRRLNAVLVSENLPPVPVPDSWPPFLNAVIINDEFPERPAVVALANGADWGKIVDEVYPGRNVWPSLFYAPDPDPGTDEAFALRGQYSTDVAKAQMAEAGYTSDAPLQIVIWYNSDQVGLDKVAGSLAPEFDKVGFKSDVQSFNGSSVETEKMFQGDFPADVVQLVLQLE